VYHDTLLGPFDERDVRRGRGSAASADFDTATPVPTTEARAG